MAIGIKQVLIEEKLGHLPIKKMMENKRFKNSLMTIFGDMCEQFMDNKNEYYGDRSARKTIVDCILNHPKIILEPELDIPRGVIGGAIKSVGELRLPFPKIVVISGVDRSADVGIERETLDISIFYVEQAGDGINVYFCTNGKGRVDVLGFRTWHKAENIQGTGTMLTQSLCTDEQFEMYGEKLIHTIFQLGLSTITRAIYMMTLQEGEVCISTPTKEESNINSKRVSKGKKPLIEFRMITIDVKKKDTEVTMPHGTHASPRQHWRRGHWRTAPKSGKKVWIDPMLVGDEQNGKIIKDYAVGHYERQHVPH
jgi:hypothetical protein